MKHILLAIILMTSIVTACNSGNKATTNSDPLIVATENSEEKYQCPMKCEGDTAYTTSGQCPICEMDLKKLTN